MVARSDAIMAGGVHASFGALLSVLIAIGSVVLGGALFSWLDLVE